jgi:Secretion system C-terminal sorting domain
MKKITLLFSIILICANSFAQNFTGVYTFSLVTASSGSVTGTGLTDPTPPPTATGADFGNFSAVGIPGINPNPNASGRFSFQGWPIGATSGNDSYASLTGALDPIEYYQVTISPALGYNISLTSIVFRVERSSAGVRTFSVRSSADAYSTNLPASVTTSTVVSVQSGDVFFWGFDASSSPQNNNTITLSGSAFTNITSPVTFRFYGWNSEVGGANGGTFSIDNVTFEGSATSAAPAVTTQPQNASGCTGTAASFSVAAVGANSYQWQVDMGMGFTDIIDGGVFSGASTDVLSISANTGMNNYNFQCVLSNSNGNTTSNSATLTEINLVTPTVTIPATLTSCTGDILSGSAIATDTGSAPQFLWYLIGIPTPVGAGLSLFIPPNTIPAGTYFVYCTLISNVQCATVPTVNSNTLVLSVNESPITPTITTSGNDLSTTQTYDNYQWYFGTTALGTNAIETATQSGDYSVVVTTNDGCSSTSSTVNVTVTNVNTITPAASFKIFPNPSADGIVTLDLGNYSSSLISVRNVLGDIVFSKNLSSKVSNLDLSVLKNGCYFITINNGKETITKKIIINK